MERSGRWKKRRYKELVGIRFKKKHGDLESLPFLCCLTDLARDEGRIRMMVLSRWWPD